MEQEGEKMSDQELRDEVTVMISVVRKLKCII